jgi:cell division protein FtsI (penicillin-binding protein 3)
VTRRYSRLIEVPATRGRIVDRRGDALAISTPGEVDLGDPRGRGRSLPRSAASSPRCSAWILASYRRSSTNPARDFVYLKRQLSPDTADAVARSA